MIPISTATNKAGKAITVEGYGAFPDNIAIIPNGKTAQVAITGDVFAPRVPIRTATDSAGKAIMVGTDPIAIASAITTERPRSEPEAAPVH